MLQKEFIKMLKTIYHNYKKEFIKNLKYIKKLKTIYHKGKERIYKRYKKIEFSI
jgi:hypothetical protein